MTEPWEDVMERLGRPGGFIERDLATIRKHIEDQEAALRLAMSTVVDEATKLNDLMDANIYQQGQLAEASALLSKRFHTDGMVRFTSYPQRLRWKKRYRAWRASEPETG